MENVIVCLQLFVFVHWFVKLDVVVDLVFTFLGLLIALYLKIVRFKVYR